MDRTRACDIMGEKMTPEQKISIVKIDYTKDNILPELNESDLIKIGLDKNKPVLIKKVVLERNKTRHPDIMDVEVNQIIGQALYEPNEVFRANKEKPYYNFAKLVRLSLKHGDSVDYGVVLLDVDEKKDHFEVVHWHWMRSKDFLKSLEKYKDK